MDDPSLLPSLGTRSQRSNHRRLHPRTSRCKSLLQALSTILLRAEIFLVELSTDASILSSAKQLDGERASDKLKRKNAPRKRRVLSRPQVSDDDDVGEQDYDGEGDGERDGEVKFRKKRKTGGKTKRRSRAAAATDDEDEEPKSKRVKKKKAQDVVKFKSAQFIQVSSLIRRASKEMRRITSRSSNHGADSSSLLPSQLQDSDDDEEADEAFWAAERARVRSLSLFHSSLSSPRRSCLTSPTFCIILSSRSNVPSNNPAMELKPLLPSTSVHEEPTDPRNARTRLPRRNPLLPNVGQPEEEARPSQEEKAAVNEVDLEASPTLEPSTPTTTWTRRTERPRSRNRVRNPELTSSPSPLLLRMIGRNRWRWKRRMGRVVRGGEARVLCRRGAKGAEVRGGEEEEATMRRRREM